jgi:peptidoglycan/LPS O-acetylase OafA/YrhL
MEKDFSMWPRDCSYDSLGKNMAAFCHWLKNLLLASFGWRYRTLSSFSSSMPTWTLPSCYDDNGLHL